MKYLVILQYLPFVVLLGFAGIFSFSCNDLQIELEAKRSYQVSAPEWNPSWLEQSGLTPIAWHWQIGYLQSAANSDAWTWKTVTASGNSVQVQLKKQESAILEVFPIFAELRQQPKLQQLWKPGGTVIMWQEHSQDQSSFNYHLQASWFDGFRSYVLRRLAEGTFDIRYFNSSKLLYYMQRRMEQQPNDYLRNPWAYDSLHLIAEISSLTMNWYDIRKRPLVKSFGLPPGLWLPLNSSSPAMPCSTPCSPKLPIGQNFMLELKKMQAWQLEILPSGEVLAMSLTSKAQ